MTGKSGQWTYGTLAAATGREHALVERDSGERYDHLAEPLTSYNVARLQRDILGGTSNVGMLATGVFVTRPTMRSPAGSTTTCGGTRTA